MVSNNHPQTFEEAFSLLFDEALNIMIDRQKKYGPDNVKQLGLYGTFSRLASDKIERIRRAMNGTIEEGVAIVDVSKDFSDESFEDALFDVANYAIIMLAQKRGWWGLPLQASDKPKSLQSRSPFPNWHG